MIKGFWKFMLHCRNRAFRHEKNLELAVLPERNSCLIPRFACRSMNFYENLLINEKCIHVWPAKKRAEA